MVKCFTRR